MSQVVSNFKKRRIGQDDWGEPQGGRVQCFRKMDSRHWGEYDRGRQTAHAGMATGDAGLSSFPLKAANELMD
jgi:hypothetical protein